MGKKLSELTEATVASLTDIFHLRTSGAIDKKITFANLLASPGIKIGNSSRDAEGDQVIEGIGFKPSAIIFLAVDGSSGLSNWCIGYDNGINKYVIGIAVDGSENVSNSMISIYLKSTGLNQMTGVVSALSSDGFTITWTHAGTLTVNFSYLCLP